MFEPWIYCGIYLFCYISVECLIPDLHVQKLDRKLIERKRQDTLEMCRMFTEENERLKFFNNRNEDIENHNFVDTHRRVKRDLNSENSNSQIEDVKLVETIVDKLYDEMEENGQRVTYRKRILDTTTAKAPTAVQSARRFEFAPAELMPPLPTHRPRNDNDTDTVRIPWLKRWKHGIIPYFIDPNTYDTHLSDVIINAFDYFEKATCIRLLRLRQRPADKESLKNVEWLYITNPSGIRQCVHSNEKKENKGVQMIVFGYDCLSRGQILHEIMHVLGFSHEHTRPDRDNYISVMWDAIKPGYKKFFEVREVDPLSSLPYDYASVLHYPPRAFSRNGQVTLVTRNDVKIGQREGLSDIDITKVSTIFGPDCMDRNKEYLVQTCPDVVRSKHLNNSKVVTQKEIEDYFKDRLWPYGIINYKIRDKMEFSSEERQNIDAVIRHIEKETCIEFREMGKWDEDDQSSTNTIHDVTTSDISTTQNPEVTVNTNTEKDAKLYSVETDAKVSDSPREDGVSEDNNDKNRNSESSNQTPPPNDSDNEIIKNSETEQDLRKNAVKKSFARSKKSLLPKKISVHKNSVRILTKATTPQRKRFRRNVGKKAERRHAHSSFIFIRSSEPGCHCPPPGRPTGHTFLKINADCFNSVNDLLHLFVHVLGLDHQHNMYDRDMFLHILWDKLTPEVKEEMKEKLPPAASVGFPYDYQSVMHYPWLQIKKGVTNIMYPIWNDGWAMGHWQGLSTTDVNKLNLIYFEQCTKRKHYTEE